MNSNHTEIHRVIGLIGGMSWESSAEYYRLINQGVRDRLGPLRSAKLLMYSVDFGPIEQAQHEGRWDDAAALLEDAARRFAEAFGKEHAVEIVFDDSALRRLVERAQAERMNMNDLCAHLFKDYQFGLSLVNKNTGRTKFVLGAEAVDAPDRCLSELVVQSYYPDTANAKS